MSIIACAMQSQYGLVSPHSKWKNVPAILNQLANSTLDGKNGYWQSTLDKNDTEPTVFATHNGLHWYTCILFGLEIATGTFQQAMNILLPSVKSHPALVYVDDVS